MQFHETILTYFPAGSYIPKPAGPCVATLAGSGVIAPVGSWKLPTTPLSTGCVVLEDHACQLGAGRRVINNYLKHGFKYS